MGKSRIVVSSGILTTMLMGLAGFVYGEIKKISGIEIKQNSLIKEQANIRQKQGQMSKQIDEIHWHLIRRHNDN